MNRMVFLMSFLLVVCSSFLPTAEAQISLTASDGSGLQLRRLEAKIVLDGFFAFTELEMVFYNPEERRREGQFQMVLPAGAAISRFAMKVGSQLQEGEIIETQRAQQVYEDFLHRRQDPALLQTDQGNRFNARIFPIEANSEKWLVLSYSQRLDRFQKNYVLPLSGLPTISDFKITVFYDPSIVNPNRVQLDNSMGTVNNNTLTLQYKNYQPRNDFIIPYQWDMTNHLVLKSGSLVAMRVVPFAETMDKGTAASLNAMVVLIDTSASQAPHFANTLNRLQALLNKLNPTKLQLYTFDQDIRLVAGKNMSQMFENLRQQTILGASRLDLPFAILEKIKSAKSRLLIVSDMVMTAGEIETSALKQRLQQIPWLERVDVLLPSAYNNRDFAQQLVQVGRQAGTVSSLQSNDADIIHQLTKSVYTNIPVSIPNAVWQWPEKIDGVQAGEAVIIYADVKVNNDEALSIGINNKFYPLTVKSVNPVLMHREFSRAKLEKWLSAENQVKDANQKFSLRKQIIDLSVNERILSPYTALLVLETAYDHQRYGIDRRGLSNILTVTEEGLTTLQRDSAKIPGADMSAVVDTLPESRSSEGRLDTVARSEPSSSTIPTTEFVPPPASVNGSMMPAEKPAPESVPVPKPAISTNGKLSDKDGDGVRDLQDKCPGTPAGVSVDATGCVPPLNADSTRTSSIHILFPRKYSSTLNAAAKQLLEETAQQFKSLNLQEVVIEGFANSNESNGESLSLQRAQTVANYLRGLGIPVEKLTIKGYGSKQPSDSVSEGQPSYQRVTVTFAHLVSSTDAVDTSISTTSKISPWSGQYAEFKNLLEKQNLPAAENLIRTWQTSHPNDIIAFIALGEWYIANNRREEAARAYGSLIDYFPGRADIRRWAAERLLALNLAVWLSVDSLERAVKQRPDHPSGHYLLALSYWQMKQYQKAVEVLDSARRYPFNPQRFPQVQRIFAETLSLMLTYLDSIGQFTALFPGKQFEWRKQTKNQLRLVMMWETDNNDVDFHIYDRFNNHASYLAPTLKSGGTLYADVTTGYGPECFTIEEPSAFPYTLEANYYSRGPMGYGMGIVHALNFNPKEGLSSQFLPFLVMQDGATVDIGAINP